MIYLADAYRNEGKLMVLQALMKSQNWTEDEALEAAQVPEAERPAFKLWLRVRA